MTRTSSVEPSGRRPQVYWELAPWFHLLTHPKSYAGEAKFVANLLKAKGANIKPTMLELGSGGGNNAFHLKKHFALTLTDISPGMLALSRTINPECEHIEGDMRSLRLTRRFDFVFVHDAIMYMTTQRDLARAIKTAFVHCRPGGAVLFQPDFVHETYKPQRKRGGHADGGRKLSYVEISRPLATDATTTEVEFRMTLTEADGAKRAFVDKHEVGMFRRAIWSRLLSDAGFRVRRVADRWRQDCFLAKRPTD